METWLVYFSRGLILLVTQNLKTNYVFQYYLSWKNIPASSVDSKLFQHCLCTVKHPAHPVEWYPWLP